ncbi:unnamed protein product, partial [Prunus brigantina]
MTHLDLSLSNFSGPIPSEISLLSQLVSLNIFQYPEIVVTLSLDACNRIVQNLTNLRELKLSGVNMSSVIPDSFKNLSSSLTTLDLFDSQLQGKFPESIFRLPNLRVLDLGLNENLTGSLPNSNWSSPLETLGLSHTRILVDWHHLTRALKSSRKLSLASCTFIGSNFASLGNLTQITWLDLLQNGFGGQIPWSLLNLERLTKLDLSGNNYVGQIPEVESNSTGIASLYDFSKRQLLGPIPRHLTYLSLSENSLNETIPSWLGSLPSLEELHLGSNQLNGNIIEFQSRSLSRLDLSSNNLGGNLEFEKFSKLQSLHWLNLSSNHLSLSFNHLSNNTWPQLLLLDLSNCNISEFPYFLRASQHLSVLYLSHNRIQADIPKWLLDLGKASLKFLDLSHNFLIGTVGQIQWKKIMYLDLRNNSLQGELPIPP